MTHRRAVLSFACALAVSCGDDGGAPWDADTDAGRDTGSGADGGTDARATPEDAPTEGDARFAPDAAAEDASPNDAGALPDAGRDGAASTCDPDAMPTPNTVLEEAPGEGGCPAGMVIVSTFCIDRYEASLAVVHGDGSLTPWSPYVNPGATEVRALSIAGAVPQGYIRGTQASAACTEAGKRLCTNEEWLRACRGPDSLTYPYGDTRQDGLCNDSRETHPVVEYFGSAEPQVWTMTSHPCLNQLPDTLAPTGAYAGCLAAEGALDMMGNLKEWTADPEGTLRGGDYVDTSTSGPGCLHVVTAHTSSYSDFSTGFRCCADGP